jgi:hypothetical protein
MTYEKLTEIKEKLNFLLLYVKTIKTQLYHENVRKHCTQEFFLMDILVEELCPTKTELRKLWQNNQWYI